ncbi:hypothetical protein [Thiomicrorhabdus sp.]|uniref:hypothetical protein n=1 Tax=Thiomicrorhabdus sp. TaxID=2039724 RepID=UPI003568AFEB
MKKIILLAILGYFAWDYFKPVPPVELPPGEEAYNEPQQQNLAYPDTFNFKNHEITAVADFEIEAKVLSQERYYLDRASKLSPVDFVLGWKAMSDQEIVNKFTFNQSVRWYNWYSKVPPISKYYVMIQTANVHLIPSNEFIAEKIKAVRTGEVVHMVGKLVNVQGKDGWFWKTSLSRSDHGDNADEILWVEDIEVTKTAEKAASAD